MDFDDNQVISSKEAMILNQPPEEMVIVGAGAIGAEFAYFYNSYGTKVTLLEMMDRVLPMEDEEVSKEFFLIRGSSVTSRPRRDGNHFHIPVARMN